MPLAVAALGLVLLTTVAGESTPTDGSTAAPEASSTEVETSSTLSEASVDEWAWIVGTWNGVAQPRRGSAAGAWREQASFEFAFDRSTDPTGLDVALDGSEQFESITLQPGQTGLVAVVTPLEGPVLHLDEVPQQRDDRWQFGGDGDPLRLSLRRLSDIRCVLLIEQASGSRFRRVAEVGYTRDGERLAASDQSGNVCIVTGGRGTMTVEHEGKTYYVCCSGCLQAFQANPEKVIADAKARDAKRKAAAAAK